MSSGPSPELPTADGSAAENVSAPPPPTPRHQATSTPELDVPKLQSLPAEQQDLYLLTFVSTLSKHVLSLADDDCTAQQFYLKREIFQIINLPAPTPTRVVRNSLGRCLAHIFGNGDRKLLLETINDLMATISTGKSKGEGEARAKHAAVVCLGDTFGAAGDSAISHHQLACTTLLKLLKSSSSHAGIRAACFIALGKIVRMVGYMLDDSLARDIWKQGRSYGSSDKGALVVVAACKCLKSLMKHTAYFKNTSDFDKVQTAMFKAFEYGSSQARRAAAECLAEALVMGYSETAVGDSLLSPTLGKKMKLKTPKTPKTPMRSSMPPGVLGDDDDVPSRPESPAFMKRNLDISLSFADILRILSYQYGKLGTSNKARSAIGVCYSTLFQRLGEKTVEVNYMKIVENLALEVLGNPNITNNRYRLLITRRIIDILLQDVIGKKILGETGQSHAAKILINDVLKNYPQALKERPEPTKHMLIAALGALSSLMTSLGSAFNAFAEAAREGLLQVLQHPSYTVQVYTSACLKIFVLNCPQQLLSCLSVCMNSLSRELSVLGTGRNSTRKCVGFAHGLAATLSVSPSRPLYGSVDINSRVLTMATNLLKSSGKLELRVASTQIQVAWTLIGGLMSLGPNFVKIHLSQLLLLWKNALPKPLAKDNTAARNYLEASFLAHVRDCALGSILAFLEFNSRLLTVDVSKRIATMLQSTTAFLRTLPKKKTSDDISERLAPALQLQDIEMMVQRRVMQCYIKLVNTSPAGGSEALLQSNLLTLAISLFADPDNYSPSSLSAAIANSAGSFDTIWDVDDNSAFGVTGLVSGFRIKQLPGQHESTIEPSLTQDNSPEDSMENVLLSPVCGALEHDASTLYIGGPAPFSCTSDPPATEVVNMAIQLFAFAFPLTPSKVQESILEQIATFMAAGSLERDNARRAAITVNVAAAYLSTLKVAVKETQSPSGNITNIQVEKLFQDMIRVFVLDTDQYVRSLGYAAIARMCNVCGNAFTNTEIKFLVDTIVVNREPSARAGCAMALGWIQAKVGGMAAGYHLKTILGILMSLCNDPHPTVHFWALEALARAADAAGLGFSQYVAGTLGMLAQLYTSDIHNPESASAVSMNLELELSTTASIARCVDSLINVLGPDLQDIAKSRELILTLVGYFQSEDDIQVQHASLGCLEHLSLYAPGHMHFEDYVKLLQKYLKSDLATLRDVAIDGLYNIMKRNSYDVIAAAEPGFEQDLWLALDRSPDHDGIRNIIQNWMRQTCLSDTAEWLQRFQAVLKMTRPRAVADADAGPKRSTAVVDLQDEEVAGFAAAGGVVKDEKEGGSGSDVEPLRWQVIAFAVSLLHEVFQLINKDVMTNGESAAQTALQARIADVVRMAFSASTSGVLEQRIWGLKIIGAVLKMFGKAPDPDFDEAMLLEQYQAQISSALTPAFAVDSSPELASEAVNVCAAFIATGIVTDVDRMGRILKTLVTALENFSAQNDNAGIGDLRGLSSNAQVMVKMAVFSAWAELQVASTEQAYLLDVLKPYIGKLTPLWLESLRDFAQLRFEPDISMTLGPPSLSGSLDTIYAALNRETLLKFYQDSWLKLVDAIASLIGQDSEFVFDALDGKESTGAAPNGHSKGSINYRDEPLAFFFVLFGIAFEALAAKPGHADSLASHEQTLEILQALKKILQPSVSGHAIYREAVFAETMDLLDRLVLTEGLDVQGVIVDIARALCVEHPAARKSAEADNGELSEDVDQLFELTRIIVLVLAGLLPNLTEANQPVRHVLTEEAIVLVRTSLDALVSAAEVFPAVIKTDLHACIIHILATILATPSCQEVIVPQALPTLKRFIATMAGPREGNSGPTEIQLQGCLRRFLSIYLYGQKREKPTDLQNVKNSLLAITILFTGGQNHLTANDPIVAKFLEELVECLSDRMTAKIAANCVRSLVLQTKPTVADETITRLLLPRLIAFVTNTDPEDPEQARALVAHTLTQYVAIVPKDHQAIAMSLVMPTLLSRAASEGGSSTSGGVDAAGLKIYRETSARLLELASADQASFRGVVAGMSESQKAFMEEVITRGRESENVNKDADVDNEQPTIALKMNFGI
ncbi:armadillo-type protein [Coniella lustricola]|uniref:Armadillo-type protein n=1 Tax=Coniella lustricola TaxID=2025994 RepID=A0A2T3AFJ9_9PEZI|nr:armadillo-type protein [Coniella lustricola]